MTTDPLTPPNQPALLSLSAVAIMLDVSVRHVRRLVDRGAMPRPAKLGTVVRFNRDEIEAWIQAGCPNRRESRP